MKKNFFQSLSQNPLIKTNNAIEFKEFYHYQAFSERLIHS